MDQDQADEVPKGAIETFIIDWPVLTFIGLLFGLFAPAESPWRSRAFKAGAVTAIVFSATAFVSYGVAPDWMWMYFLAPEEVAWSVPLLAVGYLVTYLLGFAAAVGLKELGRSYVIAAAVTSLLGEIVMVALTWDRYRFVGTKQEWLAGTAYSLLGSSPEGPVKVIAPLGPVFAVVLIVALFLTLRDRRAATADR